MSDMPPGRETTRSVAASSEMRDQITRMMADYSAAIDNDQLEAWPDFFVEKCFYSVISRSDHEAGRCAGFMYCDNRNMLIDRVRSLRTANVYQPHIYRHILSPPRILAVNGDLVSSETNYVLIRTSIPDGAMTVFSTGRYLDDIVSEGRVAKLQRRVAVTDSNMIDMLLVIPI
jgi:anthranilate 1,2-dioxygenase small subunit